MADSPNHKPSEPPARPLLPGIVQVVTVGPDKVVLRSPGRAVRFAGEGVAATLAPLLGALDGSSTIAELASRFAVAPTAVERLVARLAEEGILPGGGNRDRAPRAAPAASVAFAGLGPVAAVAAGLVADAGVGDVVSVAVSDADIVVVEDVDGDPRTAAVAARCREEGRTLLLHSAWPAGGTVGPSLDPAGHPCFACLDGRRLSHVAHLDEELAFRDQWRPAPGTVVGRSLVALLGGVLAAEILRLLDGSPPVTRSAVLVADVATLSVRAEAVLAVPGCPTCVAPARIEVEL